MAHAHAAARFPANYPGHEAMATNGAVYIIEDCLHFFLELLLFLGYGKAGQPGPLLLFFCWLILISLDGVHDGLNVLFAL